MKKPNVYFVLIWICALGNLALTISCLWQGYCVSARQVIDVSHFNERIGLSVLHFLSAVASIFIANHFLKDD